MDESKPNNGNKTPESLSETQGLTTEQIRSRALDALRKKQLNLAESLLQADAPDVRALLENLRIYQAELEIQNDELLRRHHDVEEALGRFTALFRGLPVAGMVMDRHGLVAETNSAAQALFNLDASHLHQHFLLRMIAAEDRDRVVDAFTLLGGGDGVMLDGVHFHDGTDTGFEGDLHIAPLPGSRTGRPQFVCVVVDDSERLRRQRALKRTADKLRRSETALKERIKELSALRDILVETARDGQVLEIVLQHIVDRLPAAWQYPELAEARIQLADAAFQTREFLPTPWRQSTRFSVDADEQGEITLVYRMRPPGDEEPVFLDEEQVLLDAIGAQLAVFVARCRDESRLRESIESFQVLAEYNPEWQYWLGPDDHYRYVSPACESISGYDAESFIDDPELFARLIHPDDLSTWHAHRADTGRHAEHSGTQQALQLRIFDRQGRQRWLEHVCGAITTADGRFLGWRGVNRDVTERKAVQEALARSEELLNATGRLARVGGWECNPDDQHLTLTAVAREILGVGDTNLVALTDMLDCLDGRDQSKLRSAITAMVEDSRPFDLLVRLKPGDDHGQIWVQLSCQSVKAHGGASRMIGALQDVTARVESEKSLRLAARVFENTAEGVVITNSDGRILAINKAFTDITGYTEEDALGQTPRILKSGRQSAAFYAAMWQRLKETGGWRGEIWNAHKHGHVYPELLTISAVHDDSNEITHYVGVFGDITPIKRSEEQLTYQAHHDALTGLPNRTLFQLRLEHCIDRANRHARKTAVLFIDLDRFKIVNDTLGHLFGDGLLKLVATALADQVRSEDTIARLGGDEFVILLEEISRTEEATAFAQRVLDVFAQPHRIQNRELFVTASVGISVFPDDGLDSDTLLRHADIAMYRAKRQGQNSYTLFHPSMVEGSADRFQLETDLRRAIERNQLAVHYQPQIDLDPARRRLTGVEGLCRWQHPELGMIPPVRFIPLAEDIGMIDELGLWVLEQGCRQLAAWDQTGFHVPRLAVNLSVHQLERDTFVDEVRAILASAGIAAQRLELEVTETAIMRDPERSVDTLARLRSLGITLTIDDFGTGYSSLAYLKRLPLQRLKIDRSFVQHLPHDENDLVIVRAILALSQSLGLATLAEGVEREEQGSFLRQLGCMEAQGFLIGRPVAPDQLASEWSLAEH